MKIQQEILKAYSTGKPFVAYRYPNENVVHVMIQDTDELFVFDDFTESGYVFAPFDDKETAYILKPDILFTNELGGEFNEESLNEVPVSIDERAKDKHIEVVEKTIDTIQNSGLSKVVISRKEEVLLSDFDIIQTFDRLLHNYPNAYAYMWSHPKVGLWLGATPETLLKVNGVAFKTMALAGTQSFKGDLNPVWGTKELQEQQMVTDFIKDHLNGSVKNLLLSDVETVQAGSLLHLKTNISGVLSSTKDVEKLVKLLHPTPAVCGLPKEQSKAYILENETYARSFYTGYLGALNIENQTFLFVNLRCFQVVGKEACLYVGGGITAESDAIKEWQETVAKSQTIKRVL